jgi:hypothetical protein
MYTRRTFSLPCVALALLLALSASACREQVIVGEEPRRIVPIASVQDAGLDARPASQEEGDDADDQMVDDQMQSEQDDGEDSSGDSEDSNDDSEDTQDIETD